VCVVCRRLPFTYASVRGFVTERKKIEVRCNPSRCPVIAPLRPRRFVDARDLVESAVYGTTARVDGKGGGTTVALLSREPTAAPVGHRTLSLTDSP